MRLSKTALGDQGCSLASAALQLHRRRAAHPCADDPAAAGYGNPIRCFAPLERRPTLVPPGGVTYFIPAEAGFAQSADMSLVLDAGEAPDDAELRGGCPVCARGRMYKMMVDFAFRQRTNRGRVKCCLALPVGRCRSCGFEMLGVDAQAKMDQAVRREYERLPPVSKADK